MTDPTWTSEDVPKLQQLGWGGKLLVGLRALGFLAVTFFGFVALLLCRLVERPVFDVARPWSPRFAVIYFRILLRIVGLRVIHRGRPMQSPGVIVANHSSWLDILALNSAGQLFFVSKSEVANWPIVGALARVSGTVFISRDRRKAQNQKVVFEERLRAGHKLLFFPEGTSSDGQRVLPFKSTLFAALFSPDLPGLSVQPVSVVYHTVKDQDVRHYGWWGDMALGPHILQVFGRSRQGHVEITWHEPIRVADFEDRKRLAASAEAAVRAGHPLGSVERGNKSGQRS